MALVVTLLGAIFNTNSGTKTSAQTPAVGDLIVMVTAHTGYTGTVAPTDGQGGTYSPLTTAVKVSSGDTMQAWVRDNKVGNAISTNFSHAPGATSGGGLAVFKITGAPAAGVGSIRQTAVQSGQAAGGTPTPVFGSAVLTANAVIGLVFNGSNAATLTPRASPAYSEPFDLGYSGPTSGLEAMLISSGETGTSIAWGSTSASEFASLVIEVEANARTIIPGAGSLSASGVAPSVARVTVVTPSAGALTATGNAPAVVQDQPITPSAGSLGLTGAAPTATIAAGPPAFSNVVLLLHADGSNGAASIVDSSLLNNVISPGANTLSTTQQKFGTASISFSGGGSGPISGNASSVVNLGSSFTQEGFFYWSSFAARTLWEWGVFNSVFVNATGTQFTINTLAGNTSSSAVSLSLNTWNHLALVDDAGTATLYLNGTSVLSVAATFPPSNNSFFIGGEQGSSSALDGFIDEVRWTANEAVYTSAFTPSTTQFPEDNPRTPAKGTLALTGIAPVVTVAGGANTDITPTVGALALSGVAPTVIRADTITPAAAALALTGAAPAVARGAVITPTAGSLAATGIAGTLVRGQVITPAAGALTVAGIAGTVTRADTITPAAAALVTTGAAPTVARGAVITPAAGAMTATGVVGSVVRADTITPTAGAATLSGIAPTVARGAVITPTAGAAVLTGIASTVSQGRVITPGAGALAASGAASVIVRVDTITPATAALALAGIAGTVDVGQNTILVVPGTASLSMAGVAPSIDSGIRTAAGQLAATGAAPSIVRVDTITPSAATLAIAGNSASLDSAIAPAAAQLTITGAASQLSQDQVITPSAGDLAIATQASTLDSAIATAAGAMSLTGASPALDNGIVTDGGQLAITGALAEVSQGFVITPDAAQLALDAQPSSLDSGVVTATGALDIVGLRTSIDQGIATGAGELAVVGNLADLQRPIFITPATGTLTVSGDQGSAHINLGASFEDMASAVTRVVTRFRTSVFEDAYLTSVLGEAGATTLASDVVALTKQREQTVLSAQDSVFRPPTRGSP